MGSSDLRDPTAEWLKCYRSAAYFIHNYCQIYDAVFAKWVPFELWPAQYQALKDIETNRLVIILKARQLGMTWLLLSYALWKMIFFPVQTVLLFSRREEEAIYLLRKRLRGIHDRLPTWMQIQKFVTDSQHEWNFDNGSIAYAFPTTAGDSYTASLVIVDEADLIPDLGTLMNSVKPTIDAGGQMVMLSRPDKSEPNSPFKAYYRAAAKGLNTWHPIFIPWHARPSRDEAWYEEQKIDSLTRTGSTDDLSEQYPATDTEALAPKTQSKRIPPMWLEQCYEVSKPLKHKSGIPGFVMYCEPQRNVEYIIGADPAEGNPTSDDSSAVILNAITGEEVGNLSDKLEPPLFAHYVAKLSELYYGASVMVERNNHGHLVLSKLQELISRRKILRGTDGSLGWATSGKSKAEMYTLAAGVFKDKATKIHSMETLTQLQSIDGATLKAPKRGPDDRAIAYVLALQGMNMPKTQTYSMAYKV